NTNSVVWRLEAVLATRTWAPLGRPHKSSPIGPARERHSRFMPQVADVAQEVIGFSGGFFEPGRFVKKGVRLPFRVGRFDRRSHRLTLLDKLPNLRAQFIGRAIDNKCGGRFLADWVEGGKP